MRPTQQALLSSRLEELSTKSLILRAQIETLKAELALIDREMATLQEANFRGVNDAGVDLGRRLGESTPDAAVVNRVVRTPPKVASPLVGSIKADVLSVLANAPDGLIALDILSAINARRDVPVHRTSLSPQLSRLKEAGLVDQAKSVWAITPSGRAAADQLNT
jgi:hypothetical protein